MSYLVMECRTGYAVVLDDQGRFQKVPNLGYEVGQQLDSVVILPEKSKAVIPFGRRMASLVAAAACFCLLFIGSHQFLLTAYGTVRLQINPDVLLEMNRLDYVIGIEGMNEDGSALIRGYRYRGKKLERVSEELADLAVEQGFLRDGGEITLTVDSRHEKWRTDKETVLPERISTYLGDKVVVHIVAGERSPETSAMDDRDDMDDDRDNADDDRADADDDRADADDDRDDTDDDRDDADDDRAGADDDRADADDDCNDADDDRADTDDDRDDADDNRDDADDNRADADDDRADADDDRNDADDDRDDADDDRNDTDDDRDDTDDDRADADDAGDDHDDRENRQIQGIVIQKMPNHDMNQENYGPDYVTDGKVYDNGDDHDYNNSGDDNNDSGDDNNDGSNDDDDSDDDNDDDDADSDD